MQRVEKRQPWLRSRGPGYGAAVLGVALMTALIHAIPGAAHIANISMLYLLVVIGTAVGFGSRPAVVASLLAFLTFNWSFVQPRFTFRVGDPAEWITLLMFLVTAAVTGQLTALLRARAEEARHRERETAALAEASAAVASQVDRDRALAEVLRRLADVTRLEVAGIFLPGSGAEIEVAASYGECRDKPAILTDGAVFIAIRQVLQGGKAIAWNDDTLYSHGPGAAPSWQAYLPLTVEQRVLGVLFLRLKNRSVSLQERRVVQSLVDQAAAMLERERLARAETHAQALAEADRLKTALLSMVSHDFRSPLASIKASASALLQSGTPMGAETQRELLGGIEREADRLNRMVGNILALSRLEADAWRPQQEATDLAELIGMALQAFTSQQNDRIRVRLNASLTEVWLDPVQIVQVLHNLVDNALKYSPDDQPVELVICRQDEHLLVEVLDRGLGLPPGDEERVFERFYRSPDLRESAVPGVGIGLAVCRGLVEAHGGQLTAGNREGGGAVFRFTLPLGS